MAGQSRGGNQVIIAAHDMPDGIDGRGLDITFLQADWTMASLGTDPYRDKQRKMRLLGVEARRRGAGPMMLLDADDRISSRLAAYVHETADPHGYIADTGYIYDYANKRLGPLPGVWRRPFHAYCGSCAIWNMAPEDLPAAHNDPTMNRWKALRSHVRWQEDSIAAGRTLHVLPFPALVYTQNTSENAHARINTERARRTPRDIARRQIPITPELRAEFALD